SNPAFDVSVLPGHIPAGGLDLWAVVSERLSVDGIPGAFENMLAGKGGRALVVFP
ncbi:alcohol dehydrogenase, partial [Streptomyces sp. NPDC057674]